MPCMAYLLALFFFASTTGLCEFIYTFMICFVALNMMSPKRNGKENREPLFCGGMLSGLMLCTCVCVGITNFPDQIPQF